MVEARQRGDADEERPRAAGLCRRRRHRVPRGLQHCAATGGVHVHHPDAESRRSGARTRDGIRNVVELEVEKDVEAAIDHPAHRLGTPGDEQFLAHLQSAIVRIEALGESERMHRIREIERDDDARVLFVHAQNLAASTF